MANFEDMIQEIKEKFTAIGDSEAQVKDVNYGKQITASKGDSKAVLTIYNGKKGIKMVWGGKDTPFLQEAKECLGISTTATSKPKTSIKIPEGSGQPSILLSKLPSFNGIWAGSDESGKGDFFGPLVVAAVLLEEKSAQELIAVGVRDCKDLTDKKIMELAKVIEGLINTYVVFALTPEMYNFRYSQMKAEGHNLNNLLAKGHVAVLTKVISMNEKCQSVLVDRFAVHNTIEEDLHKTYPKVTVVQRPRAEEDIAVAAASVLARAKFLEIMEDLSKTAGRELPKGGGIQATECAKEILKEQGKEALNKLVKVHFANYQKL